MATPPTDRGPQLLGGRSNPTTRSWVWVRIRPYRGSRITSDRQAAYGRVRGYGNGPAARITGPRLSDSNNGPTATPHGGAAPTAATVMARIAGRPRRGPGPSVFAHTPGREHTADFYSFFTRTCVWRNLSKATTVVQLGRPFERGRRDRHRRQCHHHCPGP